MHEEYWSDEQLEVVVDGPDQSERIIVPSPFVLIGTSPACDIVLADPRLPARCFVVLLVSNRLVGGSLVSRSTVNLQQVDGQRGIRAGRFRVHFRPIQSSDGDPQSAVLTSHSTVDRPPALRLCWKNQGRKKFADLKPGKPLLVGRRCPSRLCIEDPSVSSVHGVVMAHQDRLWLIDLGSTNGTRVAGHRIRSAALAATQSFHLGGVKIRQQRIDSPPRRFEFAAEFTESNVTESEIGVTPGNLSPACPAKPESPIFHPQQRRIEQLTAEISKLERQLEAQTDQADCFVRQRAQFEAERDALQQQQAVQEQEFVRQRHDLEEREQQLQLAQERHLTDLETSRAELNLARELFDQERESWQAVRDQQQQELHGIERSRAEVERDQQLLAEQRRQIAHDQDQTAQAMEALREKEAEFALKMKSLHDEMERHAAECRGQWASLERSKERLLVRRIRVQRELQQRESQLESKRAELEEQERALQLRLATLAKMSNSRRPATRPAQMTRPSPRAEPLAAQPAGPDSIELANPLLESDDFARLINRFISDPEQQEVE